jgi:3-hydroxyphenylacetate 6-hydroxylase
MLVDILTEQGASKVVAVGLGLFLASWLVHVFCSYRAVSKDIQGIAGPSALPLVGSILSIRLRNAELAYRDWSIRYGGTINVKLGNVPVIVINTASAARKLLVSTSTLASSRPVLYTFHKVSRRVQVKRC